MFCEIVRSYVNRDLNVIIKCESMKFNVEENKLSNI